MCVLKRQRCVATAAADLTTFTQIVIFSVPSLHSHFLPLWLYIYICNGSLPRQQLTCKQKLLRLSLGVLLLPSSPPGASVICLASTLDGSSPPPPCQAIFGFMALAAGPIANHVSPSCTSLPRVPVRYIPHTIYNPSAHVPSPVLHRFSPLPGLLSNPSIVGCNNSRNLSRIRCAAVEQVEARRNSGFDASTKLQAAVKDGLLVNSHPSAPEKRILISNHVDYAHLNQFMNNTVSPPKHREGAYSAEEDSEVAEREKPVDLLSWSSPSAHPQSAKLSERWREYQGDNDWKDLLDPLDHMLRSEILKYGDFAQATYDAFDSDTYSRYCGSCRYGRHKLLQKLGLDHTGYSVTKYLYAMSDVHLPYFFRRSHSSDAWSRDSNWIGFVAVTTDEREIARLGRRDIVVAWRGTVTLSEWLEDFHEFPAPMHLSHTGNSEQTTAEHQNIMVERGFRSLYTCRNENTRYNKHSASEQLIQEVKSLVEKYKDEELSITITGHSLGGALAILSAFDITSQGINKRNPSQTSRDGSFKSHLRSTIPVTVFSFGSPRVGNHIFKQKLEEFGVKTLRVVNTNDSVPKVPGIVFNEGLQKVSKLADMLLAKLAWTYTHVGAELLLDSSTSPFLKPNGNPANSHNLEAYLHLVDGYQGANAPFRSATGRDIALVNKSSNFLRGKLLVPPQWFQIENKGLVKNEEGRWVQPDREEDDIPSPCAS
eukprot:c20404_g1_i1 orf=176-2305(+)